MLIYNVVAFTKENFADSFLQRMLSSYITRLGSGRKDQQPLSSGGAFTNRCKTGRLGHSKEWGPVPRPLPHGACNAVAAPRHEPHSRARSICFVYRERAVKVSGLNFSGFEEVS